MTEKQLIDKYLGIPYKHMGRDLDGLDCWGLSILAYRDDGIELFDLDNYEKNWALHGKNHFIENYYKKWQQKKFPLFFDVLLFNNSKGVTNHAGIYLSKGRFIHGSRAGVVITRLVGKFKDRLEGTYRYDRT